MKAKKSNSPSANKVKFLLNYPIGIIKGASRKVMKIKNLIILLILSKNLFFDRTVNRQQDDRAANRNN